MVVKNACISLHMYINLYCKMFHIPEQGDKEEVQIAKEIQKALKQALPAVSGTSSILLHETLTTNMLCVW